MQHTQAHVVGRVNGLLRECHGLAVSCGCDAVLLFVVDDEVHCWASPALEGLVTEHAPRQVIKSLLLAPVPSKERQETLALYLSGKLSGEEHEFPGVVQENDEVDSDLSLLEDVEQRERHFKQTVAHIYAEAEGICKLVSPINEKTYEYLFVVAVPTGKIFPFATPGLRPLVATPEGQKLISTLLETNLKLLAEEGDPDAPRRQEAAVQRALQKMQEKGGQ